MIKLRNSRSLLNLHQSSSNQKPGKFYNNADSFSMSFDDAWETLKRKNNWAIISDEEKTKVVLQNLSEHPFVQESYETALKIAEFRVRLLQLK